MSQRRIWSAAGCSKLARAGSRRASASPMARARAGRQGQLGKGRAGAPGQQPQRAFGQRDDGAAVAARAAPGGSRDRGPGLRHAEARRSGTAVISAGSAGFASFRVKLPVAPSSRWFRSRSDVRRVRVPVTPQWSRARRVRISGESCGGGRLRRLPAGRPGSGPGAWAQDIGGAAGGKGDGRRIRLDKVSIFVRI